MDTLGRFRWRSAGARPSARKDIAGHKLIRAIAERRAFPLSSLSMNLAQILAQRSRSELTIVVFVGLAIIGFLDTITPWEFSLFILYSVPVFVAAWGLGRRTAIGFAILATLLSCLANLESHPYALPGYAWSNVNRLVALLFVAICGATMRDYREAARKRGEALERTRELEREIVRTSEREQMRIGQDLHDGVCQSLAAINCAAECLKVELEHSGLRYATTVGEIQQMLSTTTVEARSLARGIFPVQLDVHGLSAALSELVATTYKLRHSSVSFETSGEVDVREPETAMHLYRITQEALSNAMRHANATHVRVRLVGDGEKLIVSVSDDGCGSATQIRPDGMGFRTMQYRAKLIGAEIKVLTERAAGTTIRCTLPLRDKG